MRGLERREEGWHGRPLSGASWQRSAQLQLARSVGVPGVKGRVSSEGPCTPARRSQRSSTAERQRPCSAPPMGRSEGPGRPRPRPSGWRHSAAAKVPRASPIPIYGPAGEAAPLHASAAMARNAGGPAGRVGLTGSTAATTDTRRAQRECGVGLRTSDHSGGQDERSGVSYRMDAEQNVR